MSKLNTTWVAVSLVAVIVVAHFVWLIVHTVPAYSTPAASGHFVQARLMSEGSGTGFKPESELQFVNGNFMATKSGAYHSRVPPGFAAMLAAVRVVGGDQAVFYLAPLLSSLALVFLFLAARVRVGNGNAIVATLLLAVVADANLQGITSDVNAAVLCVFMLGLWLLERWYAAQSSARAVAAAAVLGLLPLFVYPMAVVSIATIAFLAYSCWRDRQHFRQLAFATLALAVPIVFLVIYNHAIYGKVIPAGYGHELPEVDEALRNVLSDWRSGIRGFLADGAGVFAGFGLAGMFAMLISPPGKALSIMMLLITFPLLLFSMAFPEAQNSEHLGFLIPIVPLFFLACLWFVRMQGGARIVRTGLASLVVLHVLLGVSGSVESMARARERSARARAVAVWVEEGVPDNSIVIGPDACLELLDYYGRWRLSADTLVPARSTGPIADASNDRLEAKGYLDKIEKWAGDGTKVFWLATRDHVEDFQTMLGGKVRFAMVKPLKLPGKLDKHRPWGPGDDLISYELIRSTPANPGH